MPLSLAEKGGRCMPSIGFAVVPVPGPCGPRPRPARPEPRRRSERVLLLRIAGFSMIFPRVRPHRGVALTADTRHSPCVPQRSNRERNGTTFGVPRAARCRVSWS
eukprot:6777069-Prymnesium_polylepis.1